MLTGTGQQLALIDATSSDEKQDIKVVCPQHTATLQSQLPQRSLPISLAGTPATTPAVRGRPAVKPAASHGPHVMDIAFATITAGGQLTLPKTIQKIR